MICHVSGYAGFCFGVSLAVDSAYENARNGICMLGEVVHNPSVVRDLEDKGVRLVEKVCDIKPGETALIRAHGVSEDVIFELKSKSIPAIDRTCPKVKRIHGIVKRACEEGKRVVIAGNASHPEVIGIVGWCKGATVVESESDALNLSLDKSYSTAEICLVSQTTFNKRKYESIRDILVNSGLNVVYNDTICLDTSNRQRETREFAKAVDCVIVVGGKNSSNSTKLYEIAKASCKNAIHVESSADLDTSAVIDSETVFVTGGASTPKENVMLAVQMLKRACLDVGKPFELN